MLVCAGVIGGLILLQRFGNRDGDESKTKTPIGPLSSYVVTTEARDQLSCRAAACTYTIIQPVTAPVRVQIAARYVPPEIQTISAPEGYVFRDTRIFRFQWVTKPGDDPHRFFLIAKVRSDTATDSGLPADEGVVTVPTPGYIRSITTADTGRQIAPDGTVTENGAVSSLYAGLTGQRRLTNENPPIKSVVFQPFDTTMQFELQETQGRSLTAGDAVTVFFQRNATVSSGQNTVRAQVVKAARGEATDTMSVELALGEEQPLQILYSRINSETNEGQKAFPERMWLEFDLHHGRGADQLLRVPVGAIARAGDEATLWLAVDGFAVPVQVQEIERGAESSIVTEKAGARGLPIRPEDWRSLTPYARSSVFQAARHLNDSKMNKLLHPTAQVIAAPDDKLRPGGKVRIDDAN